MNKKNLVKEVGVYPDTISLLEQDELNIHALKILILEKELAIPIAMYDAYYSFASTATEQIP